MTCWLAGIYRRGQLCEFGVERVGPGGEETADRTVRRSRRSARFKGCKRVSPPVSSERNQANNSSPHQLIPFIYVQHPNLSLSTTLGFLQLSLSFLLLLTLLLTPPHFTPLSHNTSPPNPAQLASPLSRLFFSWNESRMWGWYRRSGKAADHEFLEFVPPLPDYLRAGWVLGLFRWKGDEVREAEEVEDERKGEGQEETPSGAVREFIWAFRWELVKILGFAVVWIVAIFLSPLSMNLVRRPRSGPPPFANL